ncbi:oxidoreductase, short chain dehydrogenase/reductase family protein [delta proteobacterium NaphS2]|nr:oxidoreductase, short chain dehydrogenase/reductase family protein [delta proteobacterium NaphS2]
MILESKSAIVTGAGRGVGKGIALDFAKQGADVLVNYSSSEGPAREVVDEIEKMGRKAIAYKADVSKEEEVVGMVEAAISAFGKLDILVNNSGNSAPAMLHKMTLDQWNSVIGVHLTGAFLCMREAAKHMKQRKEGKIINVISVAGIQGSVGQPNYAAAKGGIIGLTKSGAKELSRYNIRVNAVSLGVVTTDMTAKIMNDDKFRELTLNRVLLHKAFSPEEIGPVFSFLASEGAESIQGQVIPVDGGIAGLG